MGHTAFLAAGGAVALLSLAGCGLSGTVNAAHQGNGTYKITGHITKSSTPSQNITSNSPSPSPSAPTSMALHSGSTLPQATQSTATTVPSSNTGTASTASPFNSVIQQAMEDIQGHTPLPLQAPRIVPATAYDMTGGQLTAQTHVGLDLWTVHLRDTAVAEPVNASAISQQLTATPDVGSFGMQQLASNAVGTNSLDETTLRQFNPLWTAHQGIMNATGKEQIVVGAAHSGLDATAYGFSGTFNNAKLTWQEGDWTVEIVGGSPRYEQDMAYGVVNYLHTNYLPPYPGLIMIQLIHTGPSAATTAVTHIDWIDGRYLMHVDTRVPSATNPVVAATMAVSWNHF